MSVSPSGEQFEIAAGDQRAVVVEVGGGLRAYRAGGKDVLDGYGEDEMCTSGRGQVLAPWPNRLQDGSYEFAGTHHQLPLTEPEHANAIHGLVRWAPWAAAEREPHRIVMTDVLHPRPGYPFRLELAIDYSLSEDGLRVATSATNTGSRPCPYGSGAHPYLTVGTETVDSAFLRAPAAAVLQSNGRGIPVGKASVAGTELDFREPRPIGATKLDHAFTDLDRGEDGLARVRLLDLETETELELWVDEAYTYLMLFTGDQLPDVNRRSLAVEPMTCPPNAFRSGEDVIVLGPGETFTGTWGIVPGRGERAS